MSRVFITGSGDGLGLLAGRLLAAGGHAVTLHARNQGRPTTPARRCWRRTGPRWTAWSSGWTESGSSCSARIAYR